MGDEEEAVMRGTISYAMSQVRDQHSHQVRTIRVHVGRSLARDKSPCC